MKKLNIAVFALTGIAVAMIALADNNPKEKKPIVIPVKETKYTGMYCPAQEYPIKSQDFVDTDSPYQHCSCGVGVYLPHDNGKSSCTYCGKTLE